MHRLEPRDAAIRTWAPNLEPLLQVVRGAEHHLLEVGTTAAGMVEREHVDPASDPHEQVGGRHAPVHVVPVLAVVPLGLAVELHLLGDLVHVLHGQEVLGKIENRLGLVAVEGERRLVEAVHLGSGPLREAVVVVLLPVGDYLGVLVVFGWLEVELVVGVGVEVEVEVIAIGVRVIVDGIRCHRQRIRGAASAGSWGRSRANVRPALQSNSPLLVGVDDGGGQQNVASC